MVRQQNERRLTMFLEKILNLFKTKSAVPETTTIQHPRDTLRNTLTEIAMPERSSAEPKFLSACYQVEEPNEYEGHFKNGVLCNVFPRNKAISLDEDRQTAYDARYIVSDGIKYDLENPDSIKAIPIPNCKDDSSMPYVTRDLGNILKMRANRENRPHIAVPLTYKAANIMMFSPISWDKKDFYMIIKHLWLIGEIEYADHLLAKLEKQLPFMTDDEWVVDSQIKYEEEFAERIGTTITKEERASWEEWRKNIVASTEKDAQYYDRNYWIGEYNKHLEYQNIVDCLGDKAPKSFGGYMRMKKQNTKNFQKIKELAEESNITIS